MNTTDSTVFLVDDDSSVRTALTRLLQSEGYRVKAYASADAFLAQQDSRQAGCIVSDLTMPGRSGLELQHALSSSSPPRPIVFISGHGTVHSSVEAMRNGAVDFLTKPLNDAELLLAVDHAIEKDRRSRVEFEMLGAINRRHATLTPREREVLAHVSAGRLNKQIAADLGTVEKTIKVHRARVMEKMEVSSVAELARCCERAGIGSETRPSVSSTSASRLSTT
jgi:FixJ family two-component response regulator